MTDKIEGAVEVGDPYIFVEGGKVGVTLTHYFKLDGVANALSQSGVIGMDLNPTIFSSELIDLDMEFEKFFLATKSQKIIMSTPDLNDEKDPSEISVYDVVDFLVGDTVDT